MIPAPFIAGCPSALDRAAWLLLSSDRFAAAAWPLSPVAQLLYLALALFVVLAALVAWQVRNQDVAAGTALVAVAVHPPLLLGIAPLLVRRAQGGAGFGRREWLRLLLTAIGVLALLGWATPDCAIERRAGLATVLRGSVETFRSGVGVIALLLALFETLRRPRGALVRTSWLVVACSLVAAALFQSFDARVSLVPAAVVLWCLAASGAFALVAARSAMVARIGAVMLLSLVPVLQIWGVSTGAIVPGEPTRTSARAVLQMLDRMWRPSVLLREDEAHDWVANLWAIGARHHGRTFEIVDIFKAQTEAGAGRVLYAFSRGARRLERRGVLMAPLDAAPLSATPLLWRALSASQCERLPREWTDVTQLVANSQISGVFERGATGRHALIYAALPSDTTIAPIDWPEVARPGLRLTGFDLTRADARREYYQAALGDDLPLTMIPSDAKYVVRIVLGHIEREPGSLAVAFGDTPSRIVARLDGGTNTDRLELCRSGQDLPVIGLREGQPTTTIDFSSPAAFGGGWHVPERDGTTRFRWTARADAQLRVVIVEPIRATLTLHVLESATQGRPEADAVLLNGAAATCEARDDGRCTWLLPVEAMRAGLNVITVRAAIGPPATPASVPLGLKVAGAELRALR